MMTSTLRLAFLAAVSSTLTACPLAPGCGAFNGASDQVFARANGDSAIACGNGGFVATLGNVSMEGRVTADAVADGPTGAFAFDFSHTSTSATSTTIGTDWTAVDTNEVTLDHADTLCQDLTTRTWWTASTLQQLPVATAFSKAPENYLSIDDCRAVNQANPDAICEDVMLLCPDGSAQLVTAEGSDHGTYTVDVGQLGVTTEKWGIAGTYTNGSLDTFGLIPGSNYKVTWQTKALADVSLRCK